MTEARNSGLDATVSVGPELAGPANAGLNFIDDQQQLMMCGQFTEFAHEVIAGRKYTRFTLNRFEHDCDGFRIDQSGNRIEIVECGFRKACDLGLEQIAEGGLTRG